MLYHNANDQIIIKNLEVFAHHGVYKEENILGQKFVIDAVLYTDTKKAGKSDSLEESVNYGTVCHFIEEQMQKQEDMLLEKVAERISIEILKEFPLIRMIDFEIKKPWAPVLMHFEYVGVKIRRMWHRAYIGLGSNIGDKEKHLMTALDKMAALDTIRIVKTASFIETEPYGYVEQDYFLNTVTCIDTLLEPEELLEELFRIEKEEGRKREIHWGPRTLDLDLLLYDDRITEEEHLIIPHPEIEKRLFVLRSLCEIAPYAVHPLLNKRYVQLKEELEKNNE